MSTRGRKPTPTAIKIMEGNRGHRPLPAAEPRYAPGLPEKPHEMTEEGHFIWDSLVEQMSAAPVLQTVDGYALWQLCEDQAILARAYAGLTRMRENTLRRAIETAQKQGKHLDDIMPGGPELAFLTTTAGRMAMSTLNNIAARAIIERREFGLTPSSRVRVTAGPGGIEMDELEAKLAG